MKNENSNARPALAIYHPNGRGTGSAIRFALEPATPEREGYITMTITPQTDGDMSARLRFADLCAVLQVLRGECESIDEGRGLKIVDALGVQYIHVRHQVEPVPGYLFGIKAPAGEDCDERRAYIVLTPAEALGLSYCIQHALGRVVFGG